MCGRSGSKLSSWKAETIAFGHGSLFSFFVCCTFFGLVSLFFFLVCFFLPFLFFSVSLGVFE